MTSDLTAAIERSAAYRSCRCDFCIGVKRWEDNWCSRCAKVQMKPPKWWENVDVCDACEQEMAAEDRAAEVTP